MSLLQPNFFQMPNVIADEIMRHLTPTQLVCLLTIIRKTRGWHKQADAISLSQFQEATGIKSKKTVMRALAVLDAVDLVSTEKAPRTVTVYALGPVFYGKKCTRDTIVKITTDLQAQNTPDTPISGVINTPTKETINKKEKEKRADSAQVKPTSAAAAPPTHQPPEHPSDARSTRTVARSTEGVNPEIEEIFKRLHEACKV